jgi:LysR family transcriptional regulator, chromosome initiation inhibitor
MMFDYSQLEALIAVSREGSFDGAARTLGLTPSAISQRIRKLEERVGAVLVKRVGDPIPTALGRLMCCHAETVRMLESQFLSSPGWSAPLSGSNEVRIRIAVGEANLSTWFIEALKHDAADATPKRLDLVIPSDGDVCGAMKSGEALAALSFEKRAMHGFKSIHLGTLIFRATASPDFIQRYFPGGLTPEALALAPSLRHPGWESLIDQWTTQVCGASPALNGHTIPSFYGSVAACRSGLAWGLNPSTMVDQLIHDGRLFELANDVVVKREVYWHYALLISDLLKPMTKSIRQAATCILDQSSRSAVTDRLGGFDISTDRHFSKGSRPKLTAGGVFR